MEDGRQRPERGARDIMSPPAMSHKMSSNDEGISVLLVEDDPGDARLVRRVLLKSETSFEVEVCEQLSAAIECLQERSFDIALLDLSLPDSKGLGIISQIQAQDSSTPIVVLTGLADEEVGLQAMKSGAEDYLTKGPDVQNALVRSIRYAIERKKTKADLQESENKYSSLVELSNDGIVMMQDSVCIFANHRIHELLGYDECELIGIKLLDMIPEYQKEELAQRYSDLTQGKYVAPLYQVELPRKSGECIWVEFNGNQIAYDNKPAELIFIRDVTDRKRAEIEIRQKNEELLVMGEQLRKLNLSLEDRVDERTAEVERLLRQKDEFIGQLGHDLKTPLTPIITLLPIIERQQSDPKSKELLGVTIHAAQYMKELVLKTLSLAKLNSSNVELNLNDIDLSAEIANTVKDKQPLLNDSNFKVKSEIGKNVIVKADRLRIRELLDNLVSNAIKYSPDGGTLTLRSRKGKIFVTVSVSDTGIGMTKEQLDHIFEEFYKADESRHHIDSSGLGLSICKRIIENHGGNIWAESAGVDKGSTFYFTLQRGNR